MNKIATFCTCCAAIVGAIALMPAPVAAQTTKAPVTPSTMAPAAPSTMAPAAPSAMAPSRTTKSTAMAPGAHPSNQYTTEADAKTHCAGDTVVWANLSSKAYHFSTNKNYGKTKRGAYMCRKEGDAAGFHAAKGEKAP